MKEYILSQEDTALNEVVDTIVEADFEGLLQLLSALKTRKRRRGGAWQPRVENDVLDTLIEAFTTTADAYFYGGRSLIQPRSDPLEKSRQYAIMLDRLLDHAHTLADIARPHLEGDFKAPLLKSLPSLTSTRCVLERLLAIIANRFNSPAILPIYSESFQYIHFNYIGGIAALGVPPQIFASPFWNLGILWHEMAGYQIALARNDKRLQHWAEQVGQSDTWDLCKKDYKLSFYKHEAVRADVTAEELMSFVDKDPADPEAMWPQWWLGEFLEDLFGVQMLGSPMLSMLAHILIRYYDDLSVGDAHHPPALMRLQVVLDYLDSISSTETANVRKTLDGLGLETINDEWKTVSGEIIKFYHDSFTNPDSQGIFGPETLSDDESRVREIIQQAYQNYFYNERSLNAVLTTLWEKFLELDIPTRSRSKVLSIGPE